MNIYQLYDAALAERPASRRKQIARMTPIFDNYAPQEDSAVKTKENKQIWNPLGTTYARTRRRIKKNCEK